jgi:hypothetical protein
VLQPHLMRTATHGRGVWGLNLDETAPVTETYLRAHPGDTRRVSRPTARIPLWPGPNGVGRG